MTPTQKYTLKTIYFVMIRLTAFLLLELATQIPGIASSSLNYLTWQNRTVFDVCVDIEDLHVVFLLKILPHTPLSCKSQIWYC